MRGASVRVKGHTVVKRDGREACSCGYAPEGRTVNTRLSLIREHKLEQRHHGWAEDHPGELYVSTSWPVVGQCGYVFRHEDVRLLCPNNSEPGSDLCERHLRDWETNRDHGRRVFPATPVTIPDKEQAK